MVCSYSCSAQEMARVEAVEAKMRRTQEIREERRKSMPMHDMKGAEAVRVRAPVSCVTVSRVCVCHVVRRLWWRACVR